MRTWIVIYIAGGRLLQKEIHSDAWSLVSCISNAGIDIYNIVSMTVKPETT